MFTTSEIVILILACGIFYFIEKFFFKKLDSLAPPPFIINLPLLHPLAIPKQDIHSSSSTRTFIAINKTGAPAPPPFIIHLHHLHPLAIRKEDINSSSSTRTFIAIKKRVAFNTKSRVNQQRYQLPIGALNKELRLQKLQKQKFECLYSLFEKWSIQNNKEKRANKF